MDVTNDIEDAEIRRDFPITRKTIYMNNGAIAPTPLSTIKATIDFMIKVSEEGPDKSQTADFISSLLTELRGRVAHLINCAKEEVVLTQSTTSGLNIVARGISWNKGDSIVVRGGSHEHYANYLPWLDLSNSGIRLRELAIEESSGLFDLGDLEKAAKGARLVTMSQVLYNTGAIMPLENVGKIARENDALFCVDAAQSVGTIPVDVKKIGCHFMAFPGFKWLCGPTGIGVFYCRKNAAGFLHPPAIAGESATLSNKNGKTVVTYHDMPARLEAGFRNYPGAAGLESSLRYILRMGLPRIRQKNTQVATVLREELGRISGIKLYGPEEESRRSSIVTFMLPRTSAVDSVTLVKKLEESNIVLAARDVGGAGKAVRAAPHFFNSEDEASTAANYIKSLIR